MTTEPTENFPSNSFDRSIVIVLIHLGFSVGLLQKSYKVVTEPPSTLKLILRSTFVNLTLSTLSESDHPAYPCLIYILAFFHAVILDRRKYGKLGWSCSYDFNESDCKINNNVDHTPVFFIVVRVSVDIIKTYLNMNLVHAHLNIQWATLKYLIGEGSYYQS